MLTKKSWIVFTVILGAAMGAGYYRAQAKPAASTVPRAENLHADRVILRETVATDEQAPGHEVRREAVLMGCQFVFVVDAPEQQALAAIKAASDRIKDLEEAISSWKPGSDIARLNESAGIRPVSVGPDTLHLLKISRELNQETAGAFDVTIGPLWNLWSFANKSSNRIPTVENIERIKPLVDSSALVLDEKQGTAFLTKKGMYINLGAIGKGYAAELGIQAMREHGIKRAAVSASGDMYLLGKKRSGPWVVDIEHPRWEGRSLARFLAGDIAIATSGDAKQFVMQDGKRYGHILNPATGMPADEVQSVTIVTQSPTLADAYATAVLVMGPRQGLDWVNRHDGVEALIVDANGNQHTSDGWNKFVREGEQHEQ